LIDDSDDDNQGSILTAGIETTETSRDSSKEYEKGRVVMKKKGQMESDRKKSNEQ